MRLGARYKQIWGGFGLVGQTGALSVDQTTNKTTVYKPFFSIGITTYNRNNLLKEAILSLLNQSFQDYEILIGNDFVDDMLTVENLGIRDKRIRIINNRHNLGELENMNALVRGAHGKYFTWQFDDDLCAPSLLEEVSLALKKFDFPDCVFTSHARFYDEAIYRIKAIESGESQLFTGRKFLRKYLSGEVKALGCAGFYNTDYLKDMGCVPRLTGNSMAIYSEFLLIIRAGLLPKIAYVDLPLILSRIHENSWSASNRDPALFKQAGINLLRESLKILTKAELADDFENNITALLRSVIGMVVVKICYANNRSIMREVDDYISVIKEEFKPYINTVFYHYAIAGLEKAGKNIMRHRIKAYIRMLMPLRLFKYLDIPRVLISKYSRRAF